VETSKQEIKQTNRQEKVSKSKKTWKQTNIEINKETRTRGEKSVASIELGLDIFQPRRNQADFRPSCRTITLP